MIPAKTNFDHCRILAKSLTHDCVTMIATDFNRRKNNSVKEYMCKNFTVQTDEVA